MQEKQNNELTVAINLVQLKRTSELGHNSFGFITMSDPFHIQAVIGSIVNIKTLIIAALNKWEQLLLLFNSQNKWHVPKARTLRTLLQDIQFKILKL